MNQKQTSDLIGFSKMLHRTRSELLAHIATQELTVEEAAACLAGAKIKWLLDVEGRPDSAIDHDAIYQVALVDLGTRLPGFEGLKLNSF